jgi:serine/arginine repetitive matrix protein 1
MDVDGELKIKGQAKVANRVSEYSHSCLNLQTDRVTFLQDSEGPRDDLQKRENELKERALRNKVVRSRKSSSNDGE